MAPSAQGLFQSVGAQYKDFMPHFIIFLSFVNLSLLMLELPVFAFLFASLFCSVEIPEWSKGKPHTSASYGRAVEKLTLEIAQLFCHLYLIH